MALRIKNKIPLTDLEKFGFKLKDCVYSVGNYPYDRSIYIADDRKIVFDDEWFCEYHFELIDVLYDLIKADMVEKVDD